MFVLSTSLGIGLQVAVGAHAQLQPPSDDPQPRNFLNFCRRISAANQNDMGSPASMPLPEAFSDSLSSSDEPASSDTQYYDREFAYEARATPDLSWHSEPHTPETISAESNSADTGNTTVSCTATPPPLASPSSSSTPIWKQAYRYQIRAINLRSACSVA